MANFTNMREVSLTGKSLETDTGEIRTFLGCSILMIYGLLRIKITYWGQETRMPLISDNISRNRFFKLRSRLKVVDDNAVSEEIRKIDKFWKVRPIINKIQRACYETERPKEISIDEQMVPFYGQVQMRQYIRGKPNPVGIKIFVMATKNGIPLDISPY